MGAKAKKKWYLRQVLRVKNPKFVFGHEAGYKDKGYYFLTFTLLHLFVAALLGEDWFWNFRIYRK